MVLNHRIVAMVGSQPVRVECMTCGSPHNYRPRPPGEKAEREPRATRSTGGSSASGASRASTRGTAAERALAAERERTVTWEKAIAGRSPSDFVQYRPASSFEEGQLLRHTKFGDGVVVRMLEGNKIEVLFRDEPRVLAHALG